MSFKDLFSQHASAYARFRPHYPAGLFSWLATTASARDLAVDVGAGNAQAAQGLAPYFGKVIAVEPSDAQRANAPTSSPNIEYRRGSAENTGLEPASADLLVVAQAFHWFDHERFFAEARRIARPAGKLVVWCYGLSQISPEVDAVVHELYEGSLGPFWEPERQLVETGYRTISVPFRELAVPAFKMGISWSLEHLVGYLGTWSPLKPYIKARGENPLEQLLPRLEQAWGGATERVVTWPLSLRAFEL